MDRDYYLQRLKEELQNAFDDLANEDSDSLYGTLLEIEQHIVPYLYL